MTSDPLPFATYHRAAHLGSGSFGSVVTVYNDDGEEYALKLFLDDDEGDACDEINDETESFKPVSLGAMREISCLRLLRGQHKNIINLIDIQPEWSEEQGGAGTAGCLGMALPLYRNGSLADAIDRNTFHGYAKRVKVEVAHGILSSLAFLHDNGILHRDIKSDNILLESQDQSFNPILIDFSLAKPINYAIWCGASYSEEVHGSDEPSEHTGEVGTIVYTAPEIINQEHYGKPSDVYSVGVVLLELLQNKAFTAMKHKEASMQINEALLQLPNDAPFPNLVRAMLAFEPSKRPTARECLNHPLFTEKFGLPVPDAIRINIRDLLPFDKDDNTGENESPNITDRPNSGKNKNSSSVLKRITLIDKLCSELDSTNPITKDAALEYSLLLDELDENINNLEKSQGLLDCVVLAHRFFELHLLDLDDLDKQSKGRFASWRLHDYVDSESSIFMMTDYCLYPRKVHLPYPSDKRC